MQYAFDLDGTLVDTRAVVRDAYASTGIELPEDFFGRTFSEWFTGDAQEAQRVHSEKQLYYHAHAKEVKELPLMSLFRALVMAGRAPRILTGASQTSYQILTEVFPILGSAVAITGLSREAKARVLNESSFDTGIMFEDDFHAASYLKLNTRWTICFTC